MTQTSPSPPSARPSAGSARSPARAGCEPPRRRGWLAGAARAVAVRAHLQRLLHESAEVAVRRVFGHGGGGGLHRQRNLPQVCRLLRTPHTASAAGRRRGGAGPIAARARPCAPLGAQRHGAARRALQLYLLLRVAGSRLALLALFIFFALLILLIRLRLRRRSLLGGEPRQPRGARHARSREPQRSAGATRSKRPPARTARERAVSAGAAEAARAQKAHPAEEAAAAGRRSDGCALQPAGAASESDSIACANMMRSSPDRALLQ
jgi:hypothetical protein